VKLYLDDLRPCPDGFTVARTASEAIALLKTGEVTFASLDHDLSTKAMFGEWEGEVTGYEVVVWMEQNDCWPKDGTIVHSQNADGKKRMTDVIERNQAK